MHSFRAHFAVVASFLLATFLFASEAKADDVKRECIAASTLGQTLHREEKLIAAREQMLLCARDACPAVIRNYCVRWLGEIEEQTPSVVVRAQYADGADLLDARVVVDGRAGRIDGRPITLDPGEHLVVVEKDDDGTRKEEKVIVADREKSRVLVIQLSVPRMQPQALSKEPTPTRSEGVHADAQTEGGVPTGAWILGGVGLAALGSSAYLALAARSDYDTLTTACAPHCASTAADPARAKVLASEITLGVGVAAVGSALVWALVSPPKRPISTAFSPRFDVAPAPGGAFATLSGTY